VRDNHVDPAVLSWVDKDQPSARAPLADLHPIELGLCHIDQSAILSAAKHKGRLVDLVDPYGWL